MLQAHSSFGARKWAIPILALLLWAGANLAHARTWHNKDGKTIEAEFVSLRGERLTLDKGGKKVTFNINLLSEEDQATARALALVKNPASDDDNPFDGNSGGSSTDSTSGKTDSNKPGKKDDDDDSDEPVTNKVRPWSDVLGNRVVGRFVGISGNTVSIKRRDRVVIPVDYFKLVQEDQRYIADLLEKTGQSALIPTLQTANVGAAGASSGPGVAPPRPPLGGPPLGTAPTSPSPTGGSPTGTMGSSPPPTSSFSPGAGGAPAGTMLGPNGMPMAGTSPPPTSSPTSGPAGTPIYSSTPPTSPNISTPPIYPTYPSSSSYPATPSYSTGPGSTNFGQPRYPPLERINSSPTPPVYRPPASSFGIPSMGGKVCESCRREVSGNLTAGDTCPHCGVTFSYDKTNGKVAMGRLPVGRLFVVGISFVVVLIGGLSAFCNWLIGGKN